MCAEGSEKQVFYLIDEAELPGKGAESVVSLTHHHFQHFGVGEKHAEINFDNAVGQNKNHTVIWYAMWRTLTGLHETMSLDCMITGHTKFAPDYHFGIWKLKWRSSNAETTEEIAGSVTASSKSGHNVPQLVQDDNKSVVFFSWKTYLEQFFKPLKNITKYHHFTMDRSKPGIVTCKENMDSEGICFNILKPLSPAAGELPPTKPARALTCADSGICMTQLAHSSEHTMPGILCVQNHQKLKTKEWTVTAYLEKGSTAFNRYLNTMATKVFLQSYSNTSRFINVFHPFNVRCLT